MFQYKWSSVETKRLASKIQYFYIREIFRNISDHKFACKKLPKYVGVFQMRLLPNLKGSNTWDKSRILT